VQRTLHVAAEPVCTSVVHTSPSSHVSGQRGAASRSQVSFASKVPFPQLAEQSASFMELQPGGQQSSPPRQVVFAVSAHLLLHDLAEPVLTGSRHLSSITQVPQVSGGSQTRRVRVCSLPLPASSQLPRNREPDSQEAGHGRIDAPQCVSACRAA
jgi:hypothetical protein